MGKPKSHSSKAKKLAKKKGLLPSQQEQTYSIDEILSKAEEFINEYKYEMAQKFCQRALEMDNDNGRALELSGGLLLEMGEIESARHCFGRAVVVNPEEGHEKYMTLAQLFTGLEAKNIYVKGIEVISKAIANYTPSNESGASSASSKIDELRKELSTAWVAMSELYMTDLCDSDEAEAETEKCIKEAVAADDSNPEAHQALASFQLIKQDMEEAKSSISKSISLWLPQYNRMLLDGGDVECELDYNTRLVTAKILIEVEDYENGVAVLEGLVEEDDEVVAGWYLLGWINHLKDDQSSARFYLKKAKEVHVMNPTDDDGIVDHIQELLTKIGEDEEEEEEGGSTTALPNILTEQDEVAIDRAAHILDEEAESSSSDMED